MLCDYLDSKELNKCRFLWRSSKKAIDNMLQKEKILSEKNLYKWYEFSTEDDVAPFLEQFQTHQGNPFITRAVAIKAFPINFNIDIGDYLRNVQPVLERFGEHIWHFQLVCSAEGHTASPMQWYRSFQQCLMLMPNLRTIRFQISTSYAGIPIFVPVAKSTHISRVQRLLATDPLPTLVNLKKLTLDCDDFCAHVLYDLLAKCPALEELHDSMAIGIGFLGKLYLPDVDQRSKISHLNMTTFTGNFRTKMELLNLNLFLWPQLKSIDISFGRHQKWDKEIIDLKTIAGVLNRFKSLTSVKLNLGRVAWEQERKTFPIVLPKLKVFDLTGRPENLPLTMDFLVMMIQLTEVNITIIGDIDAIMAQVAKSKNASNAKIPLYTSRDNLYTCDIWETLPNLNCIKLIERKEDVSNSYEYNRQDYNFLRQQEKKRDLRINFGGNVNPITPHKSIPSSPILQVKNPYLNFHDIELSRFH